MDTQKTIRQTAAMMTFFIIIALVVGGIVLTLLYAILLALYNAGILFHILGGAGAIITLWSGICVYLWVKPSMHMVNEDEEDG